MNTAKFQFKPAIAGMAVGLLLLVLVLVPFSMMQSEPSPETPFCVDDSNDVFVQEEFIALSEGPSMIVPTTVAYSPIPAGTLVKSVGSAVIDYSNANQGYVMARYENPGDVKIKAQVHGPTTTYTYNVAPDVWNTFPLSDGAGEYRIVVLKNVQGTKYAQVVSQKVSYTPENEFLPFIYSNQYVNFASAPNTCQTAAALIGEETNTLTKIEKVYDFVVNNFTYDKQKASSVKSGYLPVLDDVLAEKKGICFDYASLMAGMLRSQGVPCKLVVGYADTQYHAWISVYSEEYGWLDGAIYFNGSTWKRLDPTFASGGHGSASITSYINDDSHYTAKFLY